MASFKLANLSFLTRLRTDIFLQAKGFPDLATRKFLCMLHSVKPEVELFALVDFDPHGVAILRTYQNRSKRLDHEDDTTVPRMRWLGLRSSDLLLSRGRGISDRAPLRSDSQSSQDVSSQDSVAYPHDGRCAASVSSSCIS